jgi:quercetin dioxygenase-like cupin family protein
VEHEQSRVVAFADGAEFHDIGGSIRRLIHPATVGPTNLGLSICLLEQGEEVVPHRHESEEAYFVMRGEGVMQLEGHPEIQLTEGLAVHIPSNAVHSHQNTGTGPLVVVAALAPPLTTKPEILRAPSMRAANR